MYFKRILESEYGITKYNFERGCITNKNSYSMLHADKDEDKVANDEMIGRDLEIYLNKDVIDKILKLNNINKEDLINRANIKSDVMWDFFKILID